MTPAGDTCTTGNIDGSVRKVWRDVIYEERRPRPVGAHSCTRYRVCRYGERAKGNSQLQGPLGYALLRILARLIKWFVGIWVRL